MLRGSNCHKICNKFPSIQEGCWVEFGYTDSAAVYHTKNLKNLEFFGFKAICSQRPRRFVLKVYHRLHHSPQRYRLNPQSQYNDLMVCFPNFLFLLSFRLNSIFTNLSLQGNWLLPIYIQTVFFLPNMNTCLIPCLTIDKFSWTYV